MRKTRSTFCSIKTFVRAGCIAVLAAFTGSACGAYDPLDVEGFAGENIFAVEGEKPEGELPATRKGQGSQAKEFVKFFDYDPNNKEKYKLTYRLKGVERHSYAIILRARGGDRLGTKRLVPFYRIRINGKLVADGKVKPWIEDKSISTNERAFGTGSWMELNFATGKLEGDLTIEIWNENRWLAVDWFKLIPDIGFGEVTTISSRPASDR